MRWRKEWESKGSTLWTSKVSKKDREAMKRASESGKSILSRASVAKHVTEREAVERERKAFCEGALWATAYVVLGEGGGHAPEEAARRYPAPKEGE